MSGLTRFFASTVLIFSFFVFVPGGAEARWYGGHWHGGWRGGWGPAFGLGLGLGYGIPPGVALLVNKKPAVKVGLLRLIQRSALLPFAHVDEVPGDRRRCSHCR